MSLTGNTVIVSDVSNTRWRYVPNAGVLYEKPSLDFNVN